MLPVVLLYVWRWPARAFATRQTARDLVRQVRQDSNAAVGPQDCESSRRKASASSSTPAAGSASADIRLAR